MGGHQTQQLQVSIKMPDLYHVISFIFVNVDFKIIVNPVIVNVRYYFTMKVTQLWDLYNVY